ncbi:MAG: helix-turn-helix domain-containing protein [Clostridia bacterium]|nr:helix-turn-helix domain-containing protein [Clostridia bacterium]
MEKVIEIFKPIIYKNSFTQGEFDEDCFQELNIELIRCIEKFKFNNIDDIHSCFQFE